LLFGFMELKSLKDADGMINFLGPAALL